jgi:hypothetical protein
MYLGGPRVGERARRREWRLRWHCARCAGQLRPWQLSVMTATPQRLQEWLLSGTRVGGMHRRGRTMVSARSEELRWGHRGGEQSNAASPMLGWFHGGDGEVKEVVVELCAVGIGQRHDNGGSQAWRAHGGGGGAFLRFSVHRGRGRREWRGSDQLRASWPSWGVSWPDRWTPSQRTAATTRPRGIDGLRLVGHDRVQLLNWRRRYSQEANWQMNFTALELPI